MAFRHWRRYQELTLFPGNILALLPIFPFPLFLNATFNNWPLSLKIDWFDQNETLIAIKAPHGTTLEVPDPDEVTYISLLQKKYCSISCPFTTTFLSMSFLPLIGCWLSTKEIQNSVTEHHGPHWCLPSQVFCCFLAQYESQDGEKGRGVSNLFTLYGV